MLSKKCCEESMHLKHAVANVRYRVQFTREHPDYFDPDGLLIFVGSQGSGKTLSAVNYVYRLLEAYPECKLVSNLALRDFPIVTFEDWKKSNGITVKSKRDKDEAFARYVAENKVFEFRDNDDFSRYYNGEYGVIFLVDEIQLYLNSLESKNINIEVVTQISQQRKQRKHIVATSQVFGRMAKPLREQFSCVVYCRGYLGASLQCNSLIDRDSMLGDDSTGTNISGEVIKKFWFWRQPEMFARYDTYRVIERGKFVSAESQKQTLYDSDAVILKEPLKGGKT